MVSVERMSSAMPVVVWIRHIPSEGYRARTAKPAAHELDKFTKYILSSYAQAAVDQAKLEEKPKLSLGHQSHKVYVEPEYDAEYMALVELELKQRLANT